MSSSAKTKRAMIIGVALVIVGIFVWRHETYRSETMLHPWDTRYGVQVVGMDFNEDQTIVRLRLIDSDASDYSRRFMTFYQGLESGILYVGTSKIIRKKVVGIPDLNRLKDEYRRDWGRQTEESLTLWFEPVPSPGAENSFQLQLEDFPELQIRSQNKFIGYLPLIRSTPSYYFIIPGIAILLIGGISGTANYLLEHPVERTKLSNAGKTVVNGISALSRFRTSDKDPLVVSAEEARQDTRADRHKMGEALTRAEHDAEFETILPMAKKLKSLKAVQEWQKNERAKVLISALSADEKKERLSLIDSTASEQKRHLKDSVSVYEED